MKGKSKKPRSPGTPKLLPFSESVGYQVRAAHRALQRLLYLRITPYGVSSGMWYFLRALWHEDGQSQRELSLRVGTMEPTTMSAILALEKKGFVRRASDANDARKRRVYLTTSGRMLEKELIPVARDVVDIATRNLTPTSRKALLETLGSVAAECEREISKIDRDQKS